MNRVNQSDTDQSISALSAYKQVYIHSNTYRSVLPDHTLTSPSVRSDRNPGGYLGDEIGQIARLPSLLQPCPWYGSTVDRRSRGRVPTVRAATRQRSDSAGSGLRTTAELYRSRVWWQYRSRETVPCNVTRKHIHITTCLLYVICNT